MSVPTDPTEADLPILIDTNVLIDVLANDPRWVAWSERELARALLGPGAAINPMIYAELCGDYNSQQEVEAALDPQVRRLELPYKAGFLASRAFRDYRARGGTKRSPLPDFYIGAHAQAEGMRLLTRDVKRFRTYFPGVQLIHPPEAMLREAANA